MIRRNNNLKSASVWVVHRYAGHSPVSATLRATIGQYRGLVTVLAKTRVYGVSQFLNLVFLLALLGVLSHVILEVGA